MATDVKPNALPASVMTCIRVPRSYPFVGKRRLCGCARLC